MLELRTAPLLPRLLLERTAGVELRVGVLLLVVGMRIGVDRRTAGVPVLLTPGEVLLRTLGIVLLLLCVAVPVVVRRPPALMPLGLLIWRLVLVADRLTVEVPFALRRVVAALLRVPRAVVAEVLVAADRTLADRAVLLLR